MASLDSEKSSPVASESPPQDQQNNSRKRVNSSGPLSPAKRAKVADESESKSDSPLDLHSPSSMHTSALIASPVKDEHTGSGPADVDSLANSSDAEEGELVEEDDQEGDVTTVNNSAKSPESVAKESSPGRTVEEADNSSDEIVDEKADDNGDVNSDVEDSHSRDPNIKFESTAQFDDGDKDDDDYHSSSGQSTDEEDDTRVDKEEGEIEEGEIDEDDDANETTEHPAESDEDSDAGDPPKAEDEDENDNDDEDEDEESTPSLRKRRRTTSSSPSVSVSKRGRGGYRGRRRGTGHPVVSEHIVKVEPTTTPTPAPSTPVVRHNTHRSKFQPPIPVSDHTTDRLNSEGDEYTIKLIDPEGEKKVASDGTLLGGRQYRMRVFKLPQHGDKLFMMATECAKELQYRDSYLLFNKNKCLYKVIATQTDKEALIEMGNLPYAYRSRQIGIVSARSMFRHFGSLCVVDGHRVKDDYFEQRARDDGYTENDLAVEKKTSHPSYRDQERRESPMTMANKESILHSGSIGSSVEGVVVSSQAIAAGDTIVGTLQDDLSGQIVFGTRGQPKLLNVPVQRIIGIFSASSSTTTDPEDEPIKFQAHTARGIKVDTTHRASVQQMVEAAATAVEFNEYIGQKRKIRNRFWQAFWKPEKPQKLEEIEGSEKIDKIESKEGEGVDTKVEGESIVVERVEDVTKTGSIAPIGSDVESELLEKDVPRAIKSES
ncbi:chromatin remodelling complex Rsc7/Swp82 subunit-domain-containing protein [Lipomyces oligophaga]|uniref:chromatin remodelling complex Rsc7/Swp82 subunit-domain-containing protein n=1 Tax=Lipomyces oligophaga TaxID=45792 RepID=UPI0034CD164D